MYSLKIKYPVLYKLLTLIIGATVLGGGMWLAFPGAYKLGMWFANSVMNWHILGMPASPVGWIIGLGLLLTPVGFYIIAESFGEWIVSFWH
jgi:hypothetical protein